MSIISDRRHLRPPHAGPGRDSRRRPFAPRVRQAKPSCPSWCVQCWHGKVTEIGSFHHFGKQTTVTGGSSTIGEIQTAAVNAEMYQHGDKIEGPHVYLLVGEVDCGGVALTPAAARKLALGLLASAAEVEGCGR